MRWGKFNINTNKWSDKIVYFLSFMTKKGKRYFCVDSSTFHSIKLDSLGLLKTNRDLFVSFELDKIATEEDVRQLDW